MSLGYLTKAKVEAIKGLESHKFRPKYHFSSFLRDNSAQNEKSNSPLNVGTILKWTYLSLALTIKENSYFCLHCCLLCQKNKYPSHDH